MNCRNCGARAELIPGKDYFRCEYCGSFTFPPESDEGVRVLSDDPQASCSVCKTPLVAASVSGSEVSYCAVCRGILLTHRTFSEILEKRQNQPPTGRPQPQQVSRAELNRRIRCPVCGDVMHVHPYYGPGNAVIDTCGECLLIWLDHSELSVIVDAKREAASGRRRVSQV